MKAFPIRPLTCLLALGLSAVASAEQLVGLTTTNRLVTFDSATPGTVASFEPYAAKRKKGAQRGKPGFPREASGSEALTGATGFEPATYGFGDRRSTN